MGVAVLYFKLHSIPKHLAQKQNNRQTQLIRVLALLGLLFGFGAMAVENLPAAAFFGTFQGSGYAENRDSLYFGTTVRDLDVVIAPAGAGFSVTWTTVIRGGGDPDKPEQSAAVRDRAAAVFARWRQVIAELLTADGVSAARARELAVLVLSSFEGALVIARAGRDIEPVEAVHAQLRSLIVTETPSARTNRESR